MTDKRKEFLEELRVDEGNKAFAQMFESATTRRDEAILAKKEEKLNQAKSDKTISSASF